MAGRGSEPRESERVRRLCERYVGLLARELERPTARTTLMPGVEPLLERLERAPGVLLGLLTGNLAEGAALKLRSGGIDPAASASAPSAPTLPIGPTFRRSPPAGPSAGSGECRAGRKW